MRGRAREEGLRRGHPARRAAVPFPHKAFSAEMKRFPNATEVVWCQDEPQNQGAWFFIQHQIHENMRRAEAGYAGRAGLGLARGGLRPPAPGSSRRRCSSRPTASLERGFVPRAVVHQVKSRITEKNEQHGNR